MLPAGYMYKRVESRPEWLKAPTVRDIYSVSTCISDDFCDYITHWRHNGYWFFDSPQIMRELAVEESISLDGLVLFFYRIYPFQWVQDMKEWRAFQPETSFETHVAEPMHSTLEGFDVVTYCAQTSPECSPASCNNLAEHLPVNEHCLLNSFDEAKRALESGCFEKGEPGPYRILEVHTL